MRTSWRRGLVLTAAVGLFLAGCGDAEPQEDGAGDAETSTEEPEGEDPSGEDPSGDASGEEELDEEALEDLLAGQEDLPDPNEDVEDGIYAGDGVILPVPDGWQLDPQAAAQGAVVAMSEDGQSQLVAQAVDSEEAEAQGEDMDLDQLIEGIRQQLGEEPEVDEEIEFSGAERAHRLTATGVPPAQEGMPESDVTIVLAEDGNGVVGSFQLAAPSDEYDEELEELLLNEAGFDPDSEPPELPEMQPQPAPEGEGGEMSEEEMQEQMEQFEEQMEQEQQDQ
jgi:hypothetical protein